MLGGAQVVSEVDASTYVRLRDELARRPVKRDPARTWSGSSVNHALKLLHAAVTWAADTRKVPFIHPVRLRARKPSRPRRTGGAAVVRMLPERERNRVVSPEEHRRVLEHAPTSKARLALVLAWETGMRRTEIAQLRWEWVDIERRLVELPAEATKTDEARRVPLTVTAIAELERYGVGRRGVVLPAEGRGRRAKTTSPDAHVHPDTLSAWAKRATSDAGVEGVVFHDNRHSFATRAANRRVNPAVIAQITGHRSQQTMRRYINPDDADLLAAVEVEGERTDGES